MSAGWTELQESARQVLERLGNAPAEDQAWPLMAELGWMLVSVPEELGGLGQGLSGECALHYELGRALAGAQFLPAMLAIQAVCQSDLADREAWVQRLTSDEYATAPLADSVLTVRGGSSGQAWLSGTAQAVPSADTAGHIYIYGSGGTIAALVPMPQAGVEWTPRPTWDGTRRLFDVRFESVPLDPQLVLAQGAAAGALHRRLSIHRDFALAADSIGGAGALLDMTVDYLNARRQFGRPLAMFQALKHRCADLKVASSAAEALVLDSLGRLDRGLADGEAEVLGKQAKHLACSTYARVAEEALQLHGGIAMTSEHSCHLYLKRALLNEQLGRRSDSYDLDVGVDLLSR